MSDCKDPCDQTCKCRVRIDMSVVDDDGERITGIEFFSPYTTAAGGTVSLFADAAVLASKWAEAIADKCKDDEAAEIASRVLKG